MFQGFVCTGCSSKMSRVHGNTHMPCRLHSQPCHAMMHMVLISHNFESLYAKERSKNTSAGEGGSLNIHTAYLELTSKMPFTILDQLSKPLISLPNSRSLATTFWSNTGLARSVLPSCHTSLKLLAAFKSCSQPNKRSAKHKFERCQPLISYEIPKHLGNFSLIQQSAVAQLLGVQSTGVSMNCNNRTWPV